ncbi:hypothetical protein ACEPAF_302 [Sanghuangporus sanghuang]
MSTPTEAPSLDVTIGLLLLAGLLSMAAWGASAVQLYFYVEKYSKSDKRRLQAYHFADVSYLNHIPENSAIEAVLQALIDTLVQSLFLVRIWHLSDKSIILTGTNAVLILALLAVNLTFFAKAVHFTVFTQNASIQGLVTALNSMIAFVDMTIALTLVILLQRRRSRYKSTDSVVKRLMMYSISTGMITGVWSLIGIAGVIALPKSNLDVFVDLIIPRLYINCMLFSLNTRASLRDELADGSARGKSIQLSTFRAQEGHNGSTTLANEDPSQQEIEVKVDVNTITDFNGKEAIRLCTGDLNKKDLEMFLAPAMVFIASLAIPSQGLTKWSDGFTAGFTFCSIIIYLCLVRTMRYTGMNAIARKFSLRKVTRGEETGILAGDAELRRDVRITLTPKEAQKIVHHVLHLEMPGLLRIALAFASFKTYAIPTISEVLVQSKQFTTRENASKRFADTEILVLTLASCPFVEEADMTSENVDQRNSVATARINWLHSRWPNIKNEDFIYTLSLFVLEPIRWARLYGWRDLHEIEQEAFFVTWKEIGRRMKIQNIPETLQDLAEWTESYEEIAMAPSSSNFEIGRSAFEYMLSTFPEAFGIRKLLRAICLSLLEDRVRRALMFSEPSPVAQKLAQCVMNFFAIQHRYFSLPRLWPVNHIPCKTPCKTGTKEQYRLHPAHFHKIPWYKPEPTGIALRMQAMLLKLGLLAEDHIPSPKYKSQGYRIEECGPTPLEQVGHAETMRIAAEIQGCPVTAPWSR